MHHVHSDIFINSYLYCPVHLFCPFCFTSIDLRNVGLETLTLTRPHVAGCIKWVLTLESFSPALPAGGLQAEAK